MSETSEVPVETPVKINPQGPISRREFLKFTAEKGKQLAALSLLPSIQIAEPNPPRMEDSEIPFLNEKDRLMNELHVQTSPCVKAMQGIREQIADTYNLTELLPFEYSDFLPYGLMKDYVYGQSKHYRIINRKDIYRWGKNGNITPPIDQIHPSAVYIGNEPDETANSLRVIAANFVDKAMLKEPHRISHIIVDPNSADSYARIHQGTMLWGTELDLFMNRFRNVSWTKPNHDHLVHETVHLGTPGVKFIPTQMTHREGEERPIVFASSPYRDIASFYKDWYTVIENNWEFFHRRFTGDNNTYVPHGSPDLFADVIKKRGGKELSRMVDEMIAELGVDYVERYNIFQDVIPITAWPTEVRDMVSRTWNYVQNGSESDNKPLNNDQQEKLTEAVNESKKAFILFQLAFNPMEHPIEQH